jgi:hypothetical protein
MVTSGRLPNNGRRGGAPRAMEQTLTVHLALLFFFNKATCVTAARNCSDYIFCTPCLTPRSSTRTSPSKLCATHIHPTWPRPQPHFFLSLVPVDLAVPLVLGRSCLGPGSLIERLFFFYIQYISLQPQSSLVKFAPKGFHHCHCTSIYLLKGP